MSLAKELEQYGCGTDPGEFNDTLQEVFVDLFPAFNVEQFVYRMLDGGNGQRFCNAVRGRLGKQLPNELVIRRLINIRKSGVLGKA